MIRRLVKRALGALGFELVRADELPALQDLRRRLGAMEHYLAPRFTRCMRIPGTPYNCFSCQEHSQRCQCESGCVGIVQKPLVLCGLCSSIGCAVRAKP